MKTSIDLPDDLYRRIKSKSALEGRAVREVATALFTAWVDERAHVSEVKPQDKWLRSWGALGAAVSDATTQDESLVKQLRHDRR